MVFGDTAAVFNTKSGCNLLGRPVETVGLAAFACRTVYTLNRRIQSVSQLADFAV